MPNRRISKYAQQAARWLQDLRANDSQQSIVDGISRLLPGNLGRSSYSRMENIAAMNERARPGDYKDVAGEVERAAEEYRGVPRLYSLLPHVDSNVKVYCSVLSRYFEVSERITVFSDELAPVLLSSNSRKKLLDGQGYLPPNISQAFMRVSDHLHDIYWNKSPAPLTMLMDRSSFHDVFRSGPYVRLTPHDVVALFEDLAEMASRADITFRFIDSNDQESKDAIEQARNSGRIHLLDGTTDSLAVRQWGFMLITYSTSQIEIDACHSMLSMLEHKALSFDNDTLDTYISIAESLISIGDANEYHAKAIELLKENEL